jgi:hypothetical protein
MIIISNIIWTAIFKNMNDFEKCCPETDKNGGVRGLNLIVWND